MIGQTSSLPGPMMIFIVCVIFGVLLKDKRKATKILMILGLIAGALTLIVPYSSPYFVVNSFTRYLAIFCITISVPVLLYTKKSWVYLMLYGIVGFSSVLLSLSTNLFLFYILLEVILVSSTLTIYKKGNLDSVKAAEKYFLINIIGSMAILMGIAMTYGYSGSINPTNVLPMPILTLIAIGFLIKSAVFPFHIWLPDAYSHSPSASSALLAGLLVNVGVFGVLKFLNFSSLEPLFLILAILSALYIGLLALDEWRIKRLIAYSSVIHISYIFLSISAGAGEFPTLLHIFNHGVSKALLFLSAGVLIAGTGEMDLRKMKGAARNKIGIAFLIGLLAVASIPPMNCFISKLLIIESLLDAGSIMPVLLLLGSYLIALIFYLRILYFLFLREKSDGTAIGEVSLLKRISIWFLAFLVILFGVFPDPLFWGAKAATKFIPLL